MKRQQRGYFQCLAAGMISMILALGISVAANSETLIEKSNDVRTLIYFRVLDDIALGLLPSGWQLNPSTSGPSKDANLLLLLTDRLLVQDGEGKPIHGASNQVFVLLVPAKETATGTTTSMVVAGYSGNEEGVPGAYKLYLSAKIRMVRSTRAESGSATESEESWNLAAETGDKIEITLKYQRSPPNRVNAEQKVYTAAVQGFYRIYRVDQGVDVLRSVPLGVNRIQSLDFRAAGPRLGKVFDGSEKIVSVLSLPWYTRLGYLP